MHKAKERHRFTWVQLLSHVLPWGRKGKTFFCAHRGVELFSGYSKKSNEIDGSMKVDIRFKKFSSNKNSNAWKLAEE